MGMPTGFSCTEATVARPTTRTKAYFFNTNEPTTSLSSLTAGRDPMPTNWHGKVSIGGDVLALSLALQGKRIAASGSVRDRSPGSPENRLSAAALPRLSDLHDSLAKRFFRLLIPHHRTGSPLSPHEIRKKTALHAAPRDIFVLQELAFTRLSATAGSVTRQSADKTMRRHSVR